MALAFEAGAYEDVKKLNGQLNVTEGLLDKVTAGLDKQAAAAEKAREGQVKAQEDAYGAASPQAKAILENEKRARETGDQAFQKTADQFRASASASDLAQVQAVTDAYGKAPELSDVEKNKKAFDDYWKQQGIAEATGQAQSQIPNAPITNPPPNEDMYPTPITKGGATGFTEMQSTLNQILTLIKQVWGY